MDIAHGELVEKELDNLIERRFRREPDPDEREELWKESVRRYNARREEDARRGSEYHQDQAARLRANLEALIAEHEAKATKLGSLLKGEA